MLLAVLADVAGTPARKLILVGESEFELPAHLASRQRGQVWFTIGEGNRVDAYAYTVRRPAIGTEPDPQRARRRPPASRAGRHRVGRRRRCRARRPLAVAVGRWRPGCWRRRCWRRARRHARRRLGRDRPRRDRHARRGRRRCWRHPPRPQATTIQTIAIMTLTGSANADGPARLMPLPPSTCTSRRCRRCLTRCYARRLRLMATVTRTTSDVAAFEALARWRVEDDSIVGAVRDGERRRIEAVLVQHGHGSPARPGGRTDHAALNNHLARRQRLRSEPWPDHVIGDLQRRREGDRSAHVGA